MRLACSAALAAALLAAAPAAAPAHGIFTPKKLRGDYVGRWSNNTVRVTGPLRVRAVPARRNTRLVITADAGGELYGCPDPAPVTFRLRKGDGPNRWNRRGFRITRTAAAIGSLDLRYSEKTHRLRGTGSAPSCAPGVTWTFKGSWDKELIIGAADIRLADGSTAVTDVVSRKQP
jgi:hypothetical protein